MWSLGQRYLSPPLPGNDVWNGETSRGQMSIITWKHQGKRLRDSCWERLNSIKIFTQEHSEIKIYPWRKAAALKSVRSPRKAFWKTLRFHLCLIAHQDFFSRDPWGAGAGLMCSSFSLSGFAAGPCHSSGAGPLVWRYVCWAPEACPPASARIVELHPILVTGKVSCIKVKLLGCWDVLGRNPAKQSPPVLENPILAILSPMDNKQGVCYPCLREFDSTPISDIQLQLLARCFQGPECDHHLSWAQGMVQSLARVSAMGFWLYYRSTQQKSPSPAWSLYFWNCGTSTLLVKVLHRKHSVLSHLCLFSWGN